MILNRNADASAHILGPGGECALCHLRAPGGPNDRRLVEIAFPAYSAASDDSWTGHFLLITLCEDCAIGIGQAMSPVLDRMQKERAGRRQAAREWLAQQRRAEGGQP